VARKRTPGQGPRPTIDPARKRWVRTESLEFVHYAVPDGERPKGEGSVPGWGISHMLTFIYKRGKNAAPSIELTEMTVEELDAVKKMFDTVFAEAREVCAHRDRLAQEAFEDGDDSHFRLYRRVPDVVER
jgi:hypothetical protein